MKRYNILFIVLLGMIGFTSCEDKVDTVINSKAIDGSLSFKLNQPQYSNYVLEVANSSKDLDSLTCVQPAYGFTAAATYSTQVCANANFATGTFLTLSTSVNGEKVGINVKEINKALIAFNGGAFAEPLTFKTIYVRLKAFISDASYSTTKDSLIVKPLYSNVISLKIKPYIEPLDFYYNVTLRPWFIVGLGGNWNNSVEGLGSSLIPLSVVNGKSYNPGTGDGTYTTTVYIKSSESFKLIRDVSAWSPSWAMTGGVLKLNGADNITVSANGWYKITLNSIDNKLTVVATTAPTSTYAKIGLVGDFEGWGGGEVLLTSNTSVGGHIWYKTHTFAADNANDGGCKFRANSAWSDDWGAPGSEHRDERYRLASEGAYKGKNIAFKKGSYTIIFNDIDGSYYFIKK
jgi:hypothetical protein